MSIEQNEAGAVDLQDKLEHLLELVSSTDRSSLIALSYRGATIDDNLDRMLGWVTMADNKALIALTFQGAIIAGLAVMADPMRLIVASTTEPWRKWALLLVLLLFLGTFFASIWNLLRTIAPRIARHTGPFHPSDLFFYGSIAEMPLDEFVHRMERVQRPEVHAALLRITHINASIALKKFTNLRTAYWCLGAQMISFMLAALIILL